MDGCVHCQAMSWIDSCELGATFGIHTQPHGGQLGVGWPPGAHNIGVSRVGRRDVRGLTNGKQWHASCEPGYQRVGRS